MKFGILYEMETPRPWHERSEYNVYWEALAQIELADRIVGLRQGRLARTPGQVWHDEGRIVLRTATQVPWHCRRIVAQCLQIPVNQIRVIKPRIGGGFGAKQEIILAALRLILRRIEINSDEYSLAIMHL